MSVCSVAFNGSIPTTLLNGTVWDSEPEESDGGNKMGECEGAQLFGENRGPRPSADGLAELPYIVHSRITQDTP